MPGSVSPFVGILFPLYPFVTSGRASGSRTEAADGTLTISFPVDLLGDEGRRVVFTPRADFARTAEDLTVTWGDYVYADGWADTDIGFVLQHARVGAILAPVGDGVLASPFFYGFETPLSRIPVTGGAHYLGQAFGFNAGTRSPGVLLGEVALTADFFRNSIRGRIYDISIASDSGVSTPLGLEVVLSGFVDRVPDPERARLEGGLLIQDVATGAEVAGAGGFYGRFFGPEAEELAATWTAVSPEVDIWGAFGARTISGVDASGHLGPSRLFAAPGGGVLRDAENGFVPGFRGLPDASPAFSIRRDERSYFWFSHSPSQNDSLQVFLPGDVSMASDRQWTLARGNVRFEESASGSLLARLGTGGPLLEYSRYGWYSAGAIGPEPFHRGLLTPASAVAADARIQYLGSTDLLVLSNSFPPTLSDTTIQAQVSLAIDRVAGATTGKLSAFTSLDALGRITAHDRIPWFVVLGGAPTESEGALTVSAGLMFATDPSRQIVGALYGPQGEELAGTFWMGEEKGALGAVRADLLPSVSAPWAARDGAPAWTMTALARQMVFDGAGLVSDIVSRPGVETTLASRADGGVTLRIAEPGGTRTLEYARTSLQHDYYGGLRPGAPGGLTDKGIGFLTGATDGVELSTGRVVELDHTRFGYWAETAGAGGTQTFTPFAGGAETPIAQVPTAGVATYSGAIVGTSVFFGQLVRFSGDLGLRADFGAGTLTTVNAPSLQGYALNGPNAGSSIQPGFLALDFSGTIAGNAIRGAVDGGPTAGLHTWNGSFDGRFHGPYAAEAAAVWTVERSDGNIRAWGSFGLSR